MSLRQSLHMALKSLAGSKLRSLLTMLGIIIGVASVIILVSIMQGMSQQMLSEFTKMGTNRLEVSIFGLGESSRTVGVADLEGLYRGHRDVFGSMSPRVDVSAGVSVGTKVYPSTKLAGVSEQYQQVEKLEMGAGRFLGYMDVKERGKVCVVGPYLARTAFGGKAVGQAVKINGDAYTIVGVLAQRGNGSRGSEDDQILLPYSQARQLGGTVSSFVFATKDASQNREGRRILQEMLYGVYRSNDAFYIMDNQQIVNSVNKMNGTLTMVLVGVAAISLLVGGIGIMNIMLVSVTERTREIGIRKSLGAKERDVLNQFIIESAVTSTVGGLLGIAVGVAGTFAAGIIMKMAMAPALDAVAVSFGISVIIGVFFGFMPARKAAQMNPIDALKYD
ncbi:ABC transporter permease [Intestinibacillus massiliensis]|uniref:ABC transporter permease n=1 Tax=Intestinibacillus massiliensis TaxID=1871029 RepID=UPI000B34FE8E|nr:ABC transporter permease [Intestinibacillus massiliensis]